MRKLIDLRGLRTRANAVTPTDGRSGRIGAGWRRVTVRFVRPPRTADEAIAAHLKTLGGDARNWTVVSSDREVLRSARRAGARPIGSGAFARQISHGRRPQASEKPETPAGGEEVTYWERRFRERGRRG
jgi:hypothetical protein